MPKIAVTQTWHAEFDISDEMADEFEADANRYSLDELQGYYFDGEYGPTPQAQDLHRDSVNVSRNR